MEAVLPAFYAHFKEDMDSLGLPAAETLLGSVQATVANATAILSQIDRFGTRVTFRDWLGAGTRSSSLPFGGCSAAFYVGVVIGSLAVPTGRVPGSGVARGEAPYTLTRFDLSRPWLMQLFPTTPGLNNRQAPARCLTRRQVVLASRARPEHPAATDS